VGIETVAQNGGFLNSPQLLGRRGRVRSRLTRTQPRTRQRGRPLGTAGRDGGPRGPTGACGGARQLPSLPTTLAPKSHGGLLWLPQRPATPPSAPRRVGFGRHPAPGREAAAQPLSSAGPCLSLISSEGPRLWHGPEGAGSAFRGLTSPSSSGGKATSRSMRSGTPTLGRQERGLRRPPPRGGHPRPPL